MAFRFELDLAPVVLSTSLSARLGPFVYPLTLFCPTRDLPLSPRRLPGSILFPSTFIEARGPLLTLRIFLGICTLMLATPFRRDIPVLFFFDLGFFLYEHAPLLNKHFFALTP